MHNIIPMIVTIGIAMIPMTTAWYYPGQPLSCYTERNGVIGEETDDEGKKVCIRAYIGTEREEEYAGLIEYTKFDLEEVLGNCTESMVMIATIGEKITRKLITICICDSNLCNSKNVINKLSVVAAKDLYEENIAKLESILSSVQGGVVYLYDPPILKSCISVKPNKPDSILRLCNPYEVCVRIFDKSGEHSIPDCLYTDLLELDNRCTESLIMKTITKGETLTTTATICVCLTNECNTEEAKKLPVIEISAQNLTLLTKEISATHLAEGKEIYIEFAPKSDDAQLVNNTLVEDSAMSPSTVILVTNVILVFLSLFS